MNTLVFKTRNALAFLVLTFLLFAIEIKAQSLEFTVENHGDVRFCNGLLVDENLFVFGAISSKQNQQDSIFLARFDLIEDTIHHISIQCEKSGFLNDLIPLGNGKFVISRGALTQGNANVSIYKTDSVFNLLDSVSLSLPNHSLYPFKTLIDGSVIYHLGTVRSANPQVKGFFISAFDTNLNLLDSAFVIYNNGTFLAPMQFLEYKDTLSFISTLSWRNTGLIASAHNFSKNNFAILDTVPLIEDGYQQFSNHYTRRTDGGVVFNPITSNFIISAEIDQIQIPYPNFENRDVGLMEIKTNGAMVRSQVLSRPDTFETHGDGLLRLFGEEGIITGIIPLYGDGAGSVEEFSFGDHETLIDIYLNSNEFLDIKNRWTIYNGEYIKLDDIVVNPDQDEVYAITTSYNFRDSLRGKERDLLIYKISGLNKYLSSETDVLPAKRVFIIYPNPAKGEFNIEFDPAYQGERVQVHLINLLGITLKEWGFDLNSGLNHTLPLDNYPTGQYFVQVRTAD